MTIKLRGDTAANWTSANPVLAAKQPGLELDTQKFKVGDGTSAWSALTYWGGSGGGAWGAITGTLTAQTDLQAALDAKSATGHVHTIANVTGLQTALDGKQTAGSYAAAVHGHVIADVTGLQSALDGKQVAGSYAAASHTHIIANVTGLQTALDGKAASSHSHVIADVTGLQGALDGKQAAGSYQPLATVLTNTTASFTTAQESKLAGVAAGATANDTDANLKARGNHTGTQTAATISDFNSAARAQVEAAIVAGANITITPSGSGAGRQLTVAATGGGSSVFDYGTSLALAAGMYCN
jgi:Phage tail repeat like/Major tropism determinant N-terminal domain